MNTITINIDADVEDTYLKNEQEWMSRIVDAAHRFDNVIISMNEGPALEELNYRGKNFLQILKELCVINRWEQSKFQFQNMNLIQDKSLWPSIKLKPLAGHFLSIQNASLIISKSIEKPFGMFVGRSSWDRLWLASYLFFNYPALAKQTYRNYLDNPNSMINLDLDRLFWQASSANKLNKNLINMFMNFISSLPQLLSDSHKNITHIQWNSGAVDKEILSWYNNIFVDIVCEKMITGQTFFPTEKTARPLATKTPFLIMAAPNYIKNLRRLGFRTFGQFWDEGYDYQRGVQRLESIQRIIDDLAKMDKAQLENVYQEMLPILDHNHDVYKALTGEKILSIFKN
jgi:hypothetical protein